MENDVIRFSEDFESIGRTIKQTDRIPIQNIDTAEICYVEIKDIDPANATVIALEAAENAPKTITLISISNILPDATGCTLGQQAYDSLYKLIHTVIEGFGHNEWDAGVTPRQQDIHSYNDIIYKWIDNNLKAPDKLALDASDLANEKAELADTKATLANDKATLADSKATLADQKASLANEKAGLAQTAADNANTAKDDAITATGKANNAAAAAAYAAATGGSPKGTYANLAALQAAFPIGTGGIYVLLDTGHWRYWTGTAWADGGLYLSALPLQILGTSINSVISQEASTRLFPQISIGINLYNPNALDLVSGYFLDSSGNPTNANASFKTTGFIYIYGKTGNAYPSHNGVNEWFKYLAFYDSARTLIGSVITTGTGISIPTGAVYMRCSFNDVNNNFQIEISTSFSGKYLSYSAKISDDSIPSTILRVLESKNLPYYAKLYVDKNIFNYLDSDILRGHYIDSGGAIGDSPSISVTGYMPVIAGQTVICNLNRGGGSYNVWYDVNKDKISVFNSASATAPTGACYVRFSINLASSADILAANIQVENGNTSTEYEPYKLSITESNIPDSIVKITDSTSKTKLVKLHVGKNIFNKDASDISLLHFVEQWTGNLISSSSYNSTGFVSVTSGLAYSFHNLGGGNQCVWFNSSKGYISGFTGATTQNVIAPTGACYVRCSINLADWSTFQIEQNSISTQYEAYLAAITDPISPASLQNAIPILTANNVVMPSKIHLFKSIQNSIYFQAITKRWIQNLFYTRISGTLVFSFEKSAQITPTSLTDIVLSTKLYDGDFNILKTVASTAVIGDPTKSTAFSLLPIGDSFTDAGIYLTRILALCPSLTLIGSLNKIVSGVTVNSEGRGGWTLDSYMTTTHNDAWPGFSPFLQPVNPYKYYGNTRTWIDVIAGVNGTIGLLPFATSKGFNASTGYLTLPSTNDVMYVEANARYEVYNGSSWVAISSASLAFTFNFTKYRSVYSLAKPTCVSLMLGMNDFRFMSPLNVIGAFPTWKTQLDTVIASVFADGVTRFAICLPLSSVGQMNNTDGQFTQMQNAALWEQRRLIIENYDNRESEGIYLVDTGSSTDPIYGFTNNEVTPFTEYTGSKTIPMTYNQPHPDSDGYNQMGTRLAAFIQWVR